MNKLVRIILSVWYWPHLALFRRAGAREAIVADVARWVAVLQGGRTLAGARDERDSLLWLLRSMIEFRNLFYYRVRNEPGLGRILRVLAKKMLPELDSLHLVAKEIGPGLFIQHGFATIVFAEKIGAHCWINQQVTIGRTPHGLPVIGDRVAITCGAKVLGAAVIGDDVTVGANAVVTKAVPPNCTVVGVPAYIIKRDGKKVHEEL